MRYPTPHRGPGRPQGFTLVELMVTVAVIGILALIAMPSMTALINNSHVNGQASELTSALQLARSEAIRRNAPVRLCPSADGSSCASSSSWTRWVVRGHDNVANTDDVIRSNMAGTKIQITGPAAGLTFKPSGLLDAQACIAVASNAADSQRVITVLISGVISSSNSGTCP